MPDVTFLVQLTVRRLSLKEHNGGLYTTQSLLKATQNWDYSGENRNAVQLMQFSLWMMYFQALRNGNNFFLILLFEHS